MGSADANLPWESVLQFLTFQSVAVGFFFWNIWRKEHSYEETKNM